MSFKPTMAVMLIAARVIIPVIRAYSPTVMPSLSFSRLRKASIMSYLYQLTIIVLKPILGNTK